LIQELNRDFRTLIGRPQIRATDADTPIPVNLIAAFLIGAIWSAQADRASGLSPDAPGGKTRARVSP